MQLTAEQVNSYRLLHKKLFGVEISEDEAYEQGMNLACFFEFLLKPTDSNKEN